jgi:membrane-associated protein
VLPDIDTLGALAVYGLLGALVFAESGLLIGFFLPGDTVLFAAGLYSGDPDSGVNVVVLATIVTVCAIAGDAVGYWFGRKTGPPLLERKDGRVLNQRNLLRAQAFYEKYGVFAVIAARWIPWVRTFAPILAGVARMPYGRFLVANVVGALTWGAGLIVLGHLAADAPGVRASAEGIAVAFVAGTIVIIAVKAYRRRSAGARSPDETDVAHPEPPPAGPRR